MLELFLFTFLLLLARFLSTALVIHLFLPLGGWAWGFGLAAALAVALTPLTHLTTPMAMQVSGWAVSQECLLGACYGVALTLTLAVFRWMGSLASASLPQGPTAAEDPAGQPPVQRLFFLLAIACFLSVRGDQLVLDQILSSLHRYPPGESYLTPDLAAALVGTLSASMRFASAIAAPLLAATILSHFVLGMMCRTLPAAWTACVGTGWTATIFTGVAWLGLLGLTWTLPQQLPWLWQSFATCLFGSS